MIRKDVLLLIYFPSRYRLFVLKPIKKKKKIKLEQYDSNNNY